MSKIDYVYCRLENKHSKIKRLIIPDSKIQNANWEAYKDHFVVLSKISRNKLQASSNVVDISPKNLTYY
jgi:hypothetical protein